VSVAAASGTVLGFDFGEKRIGVAVGETGTGIAHPLMASTPRPPTGASR
jgi:putative Holliday junction resolvase